MPQVVSTSHRRHLRGMRGQWGLQILLLVLLSAVSIQALATPVIGEIRSATGSVQIDDGAATGRPGSLHDGASVRTGAASSAMLELFDATRIVIGPDSELKITLETRANRHYLTLDLDRGLLRIVTGLACNRNISDCTLVTPYGKLGLFNARADVWICEDECAGAGLGLPAGVVQPAGRVVFIKGRLFRAGDFGIQRRLLSDDAIYLSDELLADRDSCAVIAFNDGSILSLANGQRVNASDPGQRRGAGRCPDWSQDEGLDFRALFATMDASRLSHGVFVRVVDGHVRLGEGEAAIGIGRGETAYMGNGRPLRIGSWPSTSVLDGMPDPYAMMRRGP